MVNYNFESFVQALEVKELTQKLTLDHGCYQWFLILGAPVICLMDDHSQAARSNDLILVPPGHRCTLIPQGDGTRIVLATLEIPFFSQWIADYTCIVCNPGEYPQLDYEQLRRRFMAFVTAWMDRRDHVHLQHTYFSLMDTLKSQFCQMAKLPSSRLSPEMRMEAVDAYLHANYRFPVSLRDLAGDLHVSGAHLSRFIKKQTGIGFHEYLINIRLDHAVLSLEKLDNTITDISYNSGFPNVAAFNKAFRSRYGQTPNEYRHHVRPAPKPAKEPAPRVSTEMFPPVLAKARQLAIDFTPSDTIPLPQMWKELINLGDAANCYNTRFQEQIIELQQRFTFKYAKITALFKHLTPDLYAHPKAYPFPNMDVMFDFLDHLHLLPHLDFGVLCRDKPQAYARLDASFLERFIKYILKRYGYEKLRMWRFEYTMDDCATDMALVLENYSCLYRLVKQYIPGAAVGGPGLRPDQEGPASRILLDSLKGGRIHMDFFSIHLTAFSYDERGILKLIPEPQYLAGFVRRVRTLLDSARREDGKAQGTQTRHTPGSRPPEDPQASSQPARGQVPLYVTHLQYAPAHASPANDCAFIAPYLLTVCFETLPHIQVLCFAPYSDIDSLNGTDGISGGDNPYFFGGSGMITPNGIRKPSWFAMFGMEKAGVNYCTPAPGCLITALPDQVYQLILCNYGPFHKYYGFDGTFQLPGAEGELTYAIQLRQFPAGSYRIQKLSVGPERGSAFEKYRQMGIRDDMLPIELEYLRSQAMFDVAVDYISVKNDTVIRETLSACEMRIIVLSKII